MAEARDGERGPIRRYMTEDHARLDGLLERSLAADGSIDRGSYDAFRAGLLAHIAMEEKVLLPEARRRCGGSPLPVAERLRLDHGALAALLVPSPTPLIVHAIRSILAAHNPLEEDPGAMYDACDEVAGEEAEEIVGRLRARAPVRASTYNDDPRAIPAICNALRRAGYDEEADRIEGGERR